MSLFNILVDLPHERLRGLANEFGVSSSSPSKRTILSELTSRYRDEKFIETLVEALPQETQGFLRALVFFTPEKESIAIPDSLSRGWNNSLSLEERLLPLFDVGFLFRDPSGEIDAVIFPEEIRGTLQSMFLSPYRALQPLNEYELEAMAPRSPVLEALFHLLSVLLHHPAIQTQKGTIHRKTIERWLVRWGGDDPQDRFFSFIFAFCENHNLVTLHKDHYRPTAVVAQWLMREEKVLRNEIWSYFLKTWIWPNPDRQKIYPIFCSVKNWVQSESKSPVFSLSDFFSGLGVDESGGRFLDEMRRLQFLGLIRLHGSETPTDFHLTRDGIEILCRREVSAFEPAPVDFCVLQPNFDLLVPPVVGYSALWKLEQLAEFKRRDVFTEYHISQNSILFGMRRGWTGEEVLAFFREQTGGRFSGNVEYSLDEWVRKYGQIKLRRIVLVECAVPDLAEEIAHVPELNGLLEQRISDRCYAVAEANARSVLRILREKGYEPAAKRLTDEE